MEGIEGSGTWPTDRSEWGKWSWLAGNGKLGGDSMNDEGGTTKKDSVAVSTMTFNHTLLLAGTLGQILRSSEIISHLHSE